jgi:hypothetical protein
LGEATEVFAVMVGKQIADLAERHKLKRTLAQSCCR